MRAILKKKAPFALESPRLAYGAVTGLTEDRLLIRTQSGLCVAFRAAGCLLAPERGDSVLVAESDDGPSYALSVLERASEAPGTVGIDEGFTLSAPKGPVAVRGVEVDMAATGAMSLEGDAMALTAREANLTVGRLSLTGEMLSTAFSRASQVFGALESSIGRLRERLTRSHRRVDETETAEIGRLRMTVSGTMRVDSRDADIRASGDLRLDGEKIHLG